MNILDYLSTLEDTVLDGKLPMMRNKSMVNIEEMLSLIDEMRKILPSEIKEATHAIAEKNQLIIEAHKEADEMLAGVPAEVEKRVQEHDITAMATERKEQILKKADEEAKTIVSAAEDEARNIVKAATDESEEIRQGTFEYLSKKIGELSQKIVSINGELQASKKELEEFYKKDKFPKD